jgi:hypothetical protein
VTDWHCTALHYCMLHDGEGRRAARAPANATTASETGDERTAEEAR